MSFLHQYDVPKDYRLVRIGSGPFVLIYSGGDPILTPHYLCVDCSRRLQLDHVTSQSRTKRFLRCAKCRTTIPVPHGLDLDEL